MAYRIHPPPQMTQWTVKRAGAAMTVVGVVEQGGRFSEYKLTRVAAVVAPDDKAAQTTAREADGSILAFLV